MATPGRREGTNGDCPQRGPRWGYRNCGDASILSSKNQLEAATRSSLIWLPMSAILAHLASREFPEPPGCAGAGGSDAALHRSHPRGVLTDISMGWAS